MRLLTSLIIILISLLLHACVDLRSIDIKLSHIKSLKPLETTSTYQDIAKDDYSTILILPSDEFIQMTHFECYYDHQFDNNVTNDYRCSDLVGVNFNPQTGVINWQTNLLKDGDYEILISANDGVNSTTKIFKIELLKEQSMLINQPALYQINVSQEFQNLNNYSFSCKFHNSTCPALNISQNNMTGTLSWDVPDNMNEGIYSFQIITQHPYRVIRKINVEIKYGAPFISEWKIVTNGETIYLPIGSFYNNRNYNFDFIVDWGDGTTERINSTNPNFSHTYATSSIGRPNDTYIVTIKGIIELFSFHLFGLNDPTDTSRNKIIKVNEFGALNWINLFGAFRLTNEFLEFYGGDLSKTENVAHFFSQSSKLHTVDVSHWNIPYVKSLKALFYSTPQLSNLILGPFHLQNAESLESTFYNASKITNLDLNYWNVSKVKNMYATFAGTAQLSNLKIDQWDTANVENMDFMFWTTPLLTELDLNNWDVSKVTTMVRTFQYTGASQLHIDRWNTGSVTNFEKTFTAASKLTNLNITNWNVGNAKNLFNMFTSLSLITKIDLSNWDTKNVENISSMFSVSSGKTMHVNLGDFEVDSVTSTSGLNAGSGTLIIYCSRFDLPSPNNQVTNLTCQDPATFPY